MAEGSAKWSETSELQNSFVKSKGSELMLVNSMPFFYKVEGIKKPASSVAGRIFKVDGLKN